LYGDVNTRMQIGVGSISPNIRDCFELWHNICTGGFDRDQERITQQSRVQIEEANVIRGIVCDLGWQGGIYVVPFDPIVPIPRHDWQ
jgi:hypothetical protein